MRLAHDRYRVVTGGAHGMADLKWFADRMPPTARPVVDLTSAFTTIGLWGPQARDILGRLTDDDISPRGLPVPAPAAPSSSATLAVLASRISYVGELGWELYVPMEQGARLWDLLHEAGKPDGAVPVGIGVYGTTGRIEKGYRAYGFELDAERTIIEAGMQRPKVKAADFVGREAYVAQRDAGAADGAVHADRRRPHLGGGRQALHARRRADPAPATAACSPTATATTRTSPRPGRRPRSASTC